MITLLDYGAGNVRSVRNAIRKLGFEVKDATCPEDIRQAEKLVFPGVGSFGSAMERLQRMGYVEPLLAHIRGGKPFLGICLGLQTLYEGSEETPGVAGLGIIPGQISRFRPSKPFRAADRLERHQGQKTVAPVYRLCRGKALFCPLLPGLTD